MNAGFGGDFASFPQGMDFLKQFWAQGAGSTAGATAPTGATANAQTSPAFAQIMGAYMSPTLDAAELDKRIADLKTVLQFMELNTALLRQSLHALEVQQATLSTLNSMMKQQGTDAAATANPLPWMAAWQTMMQGVGNAAQATTPASEKSVVKKTATKKTATKKSSKAVASKAT